MSKIDFTDVLGLPMNENVPSQDWREAKIREWLLLLLRFAITRDSVDQRGAAAFAEDLDSVGDAESDGGCTFFRRTNCDVCTAIQESDDPSGIVILKTHIARISETRLRRAFSGAIGLAALDARDTVQRRRRREVINLWKGLDRQKISDSL